MRRGVLKFSIAAALSFDPFSRHYILRIKKKVFGTRLIYDTINVRTAGRKSRNTYKSEEDYAIS